MVDIIRQFTRHLERDNMSASTIAAYRRVLEACGVDRTFLELTPEELDERLQAVARARSWSARSQGKAIMILRAFYRWAIFRNMIKFNPAKVLRPPKCRHAMPSLVSHDTFMEAWLSTKPAAADVRGCRDWAVLACLYFCALRRGEVLALEVGDIDLAGGVLAVRNRKSGADDVVPMGTEVAEALELYLSVRRDDPERPEARLFLSARRPRPMTIYGIDQVVKRFAERLGNGARVTPHVFRHSRITDLIRRRMNPVAVQHFAGHASFKTTEKYIHLAAQDIADELDRVSA